MQVSGESGRNYGKIIVVVVVLTFSAILLYVATTSFSSPGFPKAEKPFGEYAAVVSSVFNGTEFNFRLQWLVSGNYTPLFTQMTSTSAHEDSSVCGLGNATIGAGQTFDLPFVLPQNATTLSGVTLLIAFRANVNGSEFTIRYQAGNATAVAGNITPSNFACFPPSNLE